MRQQVSKRWRLHGDARLQDRPPSPHRSPNATPAWVIEQIESWRREHKRSAQRITDERVSIGFVIDRRTVSRHSTRLGLGKRRCIVDGFSRLACTEPLGDENGATAASFLARAKAGNAASGLWGTRS
jgi:hypothetical protein